MSDYFPHLIQFFFNSFVGFFALTIIVELFFFAFQIKKPRLRALFRVIPFFKLFVDLIFYKFTGGNSFLHFFYCEECIITKLTSLFPNTIEIFYNYIKSPYVYNTAFIGALSIAFLRIARKIMQWLHSDKLIKNISQSAELYERPINNSLLQKKLKKIECVILLSEDIDMPMAAKSNLILIPKFLVKELSQEEFETIIAHELEHLLWKDPRIKFLAESVRSVFWWIPQRWWTRRLEEEQEEAADACIKNYNLDAHALANAIFKTTKRNKIFKEENFGFSYLSANKSTLLNRINLILKNKNILSWSRFKIICLLTPVLGLFGTLMYLFC